MLLQLRRFLYTKIIYIFFLVAMKMLFKNVTSLRLTLLCLSYLFFKTYPPRLLYVSNGYIFGIYLINKNKDNLICLSLKYQNTTNIFQMFRYQSFNYMYSLTLLLYCLSVFLAICQSFILETMCRVISQFVCILYLLGSHCGNQATLICAQISK